jgi:hypothetical protein
MGLNLAEIQNEKERLAAGGKNEFLENFVRMPDGNGHLTLRLLPPADDGMFEKETNPFVVRTRIHRVNGKSLHCPKELDGRRWVGECPICRYYHWLWNESKKKDPSEAEAMQAKARDIKPIERYYYNVLVRSQFNEEKQAVEQNVGPKIFSCGKTLYGMIVRAICGDKELEEKPLGDVTDVKGGRDFKLMKTMRQSGQNSYPNYSDSKFLEESPLGEGGDVEKWLNGLHDLSLLRVLKPEEELKHELKVHLGLEKDVDDDFDPSEFQKKAPAEEAPVVTEAKTPEPTPEPAAEAEAATPATPEPEDDALDGDEFIEALKSM